MSAVDYQNARLMNTEYQEGKMPGVCTVVQFRESLMDARSLLEWVWFPRDESPVTYMGLQTLRLPEDGSLYNVHGFKGFDTEGIPWQTFFEAKTKKPLYGVSGEGGDGEDGTTLIEFFIDKYQAVNSFSMEDTDFYPVECIQDYNFEAIDQPMMPTGDFGFLML